MIIYISISITLLTLIAAMYFLVKIQREQLGSFFKWITYGILIVGILILICQFARGVGGMMRHHSGKCCTEMGMHAGMGHHMMGGMCCGGGEMGSCEGHGRMMMHGCCGGEKMEGGEKMKGCEGMMNGGCDDDGDSTHEMHERK